MTDWSRGGRIRCSHREAPEAPPCGAPADGGFGRCARHFVDWDSRESLLTHRPFDAALSPPRTRGPTPALTTTQRDILERACAEGVVTPPRGEVLAGWQHAASVLVAFDLVEEVRARPGALPGAVRVTPKGREWWRVWRSLTNGRPGLRAALTAE